MGIRSYLRLSKLAVLRVIREGIVVSLRNWNEISGLLAKK